MLILKFRWCNNQPSNGASSSSPQACVTLSGSVSNSGCMNDQPCSSTYYYICEIKK